MNKDFRKFTQEFKNYINTPAGQKAIVTTLTNIFSMRMVGNKTHGDLAEIGINEFINRNLGHKYESIHVGKDLYRAKEHEEDILITDKKTKNQIPVSLKAYGNGPLQLSTDKEFKMFPYLEKMRKTYGDTITDSTVINEIFHSEAFKSFFESDDINVLPMIYTENKQEDENIPVKNKCNILRFDADKAEEGTKKIVYVATKRKFDEKKGEVQEGGSRLHPIYLFLDENDHYIFEIRYGDAAANALQRGLWTHTKNASGYFDSLTNGWIEYEYNKTIVDLFSVALNMSFEDPEKTKQEFLNFFDQLKKEPKK